MISQSRMFSKLTRNPTGDAGFKAIFRKKENMKNLLESFVVTEEIEDMSYLSNPAVVKDGNRTIKFDVLVKDHNGSSFIVEVQKVNLTAPSAKWIYYSTREYNEQARVSWRSLLESITWMPNRWASTDI